MMVPSCLFRFYGFYYFYHYEDNVILSTVIVFRMCMQYSFYSYSAMYILYMDMYDYACVYIRSPT